MSNGEDEESFDAFFRAERGRLVSQAYVLTGNLHTAQDLAQAALESAWRHWSEVSSYERPAAWARRVLFNLAVNQHKRLSREEPLDDRDPADREHEDHSVLVEALRALPTSHQQALVLHDGVGLSVAEVASELHAPVGTVKAWLSRGRARMAQELTTKEPETRWR
jgi:RNA polymerase sigma-70 factor (ECF subfamily)